jgi:RNA polymerase sigma factor (sigma-70 family)
MMAAVVIGTALSALGSTATAAGPPSDKAVQDIGRYCTACWRNARLAPDRWTDCTQEVFVRLLERVPGGRWEQALRAEGDERRELLRAIDAVKKRTQRARKNTGLVADLPDPRASDRAWLDERELLDRAAPSVLSERQRRIVQMSMAGWSVPEMAAALNTTPDRVSDEKYKAIHKLRRHLNPPDGDAEA